MSEARIIGERYEMTGLLGQGGMATVYLGRDLQTGEAVAVKLLKREVVEYDPGLIERFVREGEALRVLNHPNIVKMLAMIEENNRHYAVMEYVSGGDLRTLLEKEHPLPVKRVLEIAMDLSDALTRAHRLKIIHRDIKPANVLIAEDGTPRLTDFGIARVGDSAITGTGEMLGTLAYMSPEGCVGDVLDARADIWSFGVMLFEMLTGRRPFEDPYGSQAALLLAILSNPLPSLSEQRPDVPPALQQLVERMLHKDRDQRIQSVRQIGAYLEDILAGRITDALPEEPDTGMFPAASEAGKTPTRQILEQLQTDPALSQLRSGKTLPAAPLPVDLSPEPSRDSVTTPLPTSGTPVNLPGTHDDLEIPTTAGRNRLLLGTTITIIASILLGLLILLPRLTMPSQSPTTDASTPSTDTVGTAAVIPTDEPIPPDEFLVLVAQLEPIGTVNRDASRFIFDDLQRRLERSVPFSPYHIRSYPQVITSNDQARQVGETTGALMVLWGDDDGTTARVNVQVGSLTGLKSLFGTRDQLEKLIGLRLLVTDVREESLAVAVLSSAAILQTFNNDAYTIALNLAIFQIIKPVSPETDDNGIAGNWYRYYTHYFSDENQALDEINDAIALDGGSPVLYMARSLTYTRLGRLDEARRGYLTASRLLPANASIDENGLGQTELFINNDPQAALDYFEQALAVNPNDWMALAQRAVCHFLLKDYDQAKADLEQVKQIKPNYSPVYPFLAAIALRDGDIIAAQEYFNLVRTNFPDPTFIERLLTAAYGEPAQNTPVAEGIAAFSSTALVQWDDVVTTTDQVINAPGYQLPEIYMLRGMAQCNLKDYAGAEQSYTGGIEVDPSFILLQLLRAEVRLKQGNLLGAGADFAAVLGSNQGSLYSPFIPAWRDGEFSCENFFDANLRQYLVTPDATPEATVNGS